MEKTVVGRGSRGPSFVTRVPFSIISETMIDSGKFISKEMWRGTSYIQPQIWGVPGGYYTGGPGDPVKKNYFITEKTGNAG